jgi:ankyrin repeat protein
MDVCGSPNVGDDSGWTPLHWAANNGHTALVRVLLRYRARRQVTAKDGKTTPAMLARNGVRCALCTALLCCLGEAM